MKKHISLFLILFLIFSLPVMIGMAEEKQFVKVIYGSNVRSGPSTEDEKVTYAEEGNTYELIDKVDGWYHIWIDDDTEGYIGESRCKVIASAKTIVIESEYTSVPVGGTITLKANVGPENAEDKSVSWSTSDNSIATVNNKGKVTGIARGEVDITARANAGNDLSATYHIVVVQPVKKISITGSTNTVPVGYGIKLETEIMPIDADVQTIKWSSSNENVAVIIDGGYVYGTGKGSCTISAASMDGSEIKGKYTINVKQYDAVIVDISEQPEIVYTGITGLGSGIFSTGWGTKKDCVSISSGTGYNALKLTAIKDGEDTVIVEQQELFSRKYKKETFSVLVAIGKFESISMMDKHIQEYQLATPDSFASEITDDNSNIAKDNTIAVKKGESFVFGRYEQDGNEINGMEPIEWVVLDIDMDSNKVLLLSRCALDAKSYNDERLEITWERCQLREWLNNEFVTMAFTAEEQNAIANIQVINEDNPKWNTDGGNDTLDRVFVLSESEAREYLIDDAARITVPTKHCILAMQDNYYDTYGDERDFEWFEDGCYWWLRSPGRDNRGAAYVIYDGKIADHGNPINESTFTVRPAIWVNLNELH